MLLRVKSERGTRLRRHSARPRLSNSTAVSQSWAQETKIGSRFVGIRRPRRRCEPGGRMTSPSLPIPPSFHRHSSPPPETRWVGGRRRNPPPPALCSGEGRCEDQRRPQSPLDLVRALKPEPHMRLFIVEDDRDAADYIARAFREVGHVADQAPDGEEGLALALDREYDVMIVDRMLPKRDGLSRDRRTARQGHRDAGADPVRAGPGRRPGEGPARRRRRLSDQALLVLRAARPRRGAGASPRRAAARRPSTGSPTSNSTGCRTEVIARQGTRSSCSRANSGCSNT